MATLHRCDVCFDLIDPMEGEETTRLIVRVEHDPDSDSGYETPGDDVTKSSIDLCESCRPKTAGAHMDWLTHTLEEELNR